MFRLCCHQMNFRSTSGPLPVRQFKRPKTISHKQSKQHSLQNAIGKQIVYLLMQLCQCCLLVWSMGGHALDCSLLPPQSWICQIKFQNKNALHLLVYGFALDSPNSCNKGFCWNWCWSDKTFSQSDQCSLKIGQSESELKASTWKPAQGFWVDYQIWAILYDPRWSTMIRIVIVI